MKLALCLLLLSSPLFAAHNPNRHASVRREFMRLHPCPSTGKRYGPCMGFVVDHIIPLACGGQDSPINLQWQTVREGKAKDRWETNNCLKVPSAQTHPDTTMNIFDSTGSSSLTLSMTPPDHSVKIFTSGDELIEITDKNGELMVRVSADGKVEYGKGYTAEDSAKAFWSELAKAYFGVCEERRKAEKKAD